MEAQRICSLARQIAKCPGYTVQSGEALNVVLAELCETYDFDVARGTTTIMLGQGPNVAAGGPYNLPADYLRSDREEVFYTIQGVKYVLIATDLSEWDALVVTPGMSNYPTSYATRLETTPASLYVWMPSSGDYPLTVRYRRKMPDIVSPEAAADVPWFPNTNYLITRTAAELMKITDDDRLPRFLGDGDDGAQGILNRYLKLVNDNSNRPRTVTLDRRRFGNSFNNLPNTKYVGW